MYRPNVILTGFMGTGKTTVGKLLAKKLGYKFIDTDRLIEERFSSTIQDIFREKGEIVFRNMESAIAKELGDQEGLVISTGGRMMLDNENAEALKRKGRVFCLIATPEEIMERVTQDDLNQRPLLAVPNPKERIVEMLQQREKDYSRYSQLVTSDKTPTEIMENLVEVFQPDPDLKVPINASSDRYEFMVGAGLLPFIKQLVDIPGPLAIITDTNIAQLYSQCFSETDILVAISPGSQHKSLATTQSIFDQLLESGFDRSGTILALGGSVISELAGFVAATYMRGVDCIQCPTSLLAMVDTCIGGKVGIDLPQGKNLMGVFKQPKAVIADIATLQSLSARDFAAGMAEVIKHSLIADSDLLSKIEGGIWKREEGTLLLLMPELQALVAQAIQVKIRIIQEDPFDKGRRAVLNLGHTFAHAIEQASDYSVNHGEGVSMGLVAAANLSARLGYCKTDLQYRIETILKSVSLPIRIPDTIDISNLIKIIGYDKKKTAGQPRYVLLRDIGDVFLSDSVNQRAVFETIEDLCS